MVLLFFNSSSFSFFLSSFWFGFDLIWLDSMRRDERCIYRIWRNNFSRKYQFETMAMACCGRERRFTAGLSLVLSISSRIITSWFLLISTITVDEIRSSYVIMETIRRGLRITPSVVKRLRYERKYVKRSVVSFFFLLIELILIDEIKNV